MTPEKELQFEYGLDVKRYLDVRFRSRAELTTTIRPRDTHTFYVVALLNRWVDGTIRAGLSIEDQALIYTVNDLEIRAGVVGVDGLRLG